jgi:hypothetical protein
LIIGIQFLAWTIGGLYFSFSDMDEIHGDHQRKHVMIAEYDSLISPAGILQRIKEVYAMDSLESLKLISVIDRPVYQVVYYHQHMGHMKMIQLADARTGEFLQPLSREQGIAVAQQHFNEPSTVTKVEYLENTDGHHEYREKPLPAWAVTFNHPSETTVYVSAMLGTVESFRNNKWRVFDFLWMLHTMDYETRDNFGNIVLRVFSLSGIATLVSGFVLFFTTLKKSKRRVRKTQANIN